MRRPVVALLALAAVSFCLAPFFWQLLTSVRPEDQLTSLGLPTALTLESYQQALGGSPLARSLWNSFVVASLTTLLCLSVGGLAAFALAKLPLRFGQALLWVALSVSMFPPIATVSPLFLVVRALGLRDTLAGLVMCDTTFALPLTLWTLTSFFRELPDDLYRAARVDGCSPLAAFWRVLLPLAGPGLVTTGLLVFISAWNEFLYALTFISTETRRTVPVAISLFAGEHVEPWGQIAAASIVVTLPLIVLTLIFQRRIVQGLTAGAVKG
jgi:multiple sugar transport system permease protein